MCVGRSGSSSFGGLLGINQPSPYASNYGYGRASSGSSISAEERQWYQDNNFGDPFATTKVREDIKLDRPVFVGRGTPIYYMRGKEQDYYRGVSNEARYLYNQAKANSLAIQQASANPVTSRNQASSQGSGGADVNYTYAGNALSIPAT